MAPNIPISLTKIPAHTPMSIPAAPLEIGVPIAILIAAKLLAKTKSVGESLDTVTG